mmetsp:Transcript_13419/g.39244  ORF Transcript_13419/g.39244 Transcript_13419/m.39244 type:complete len:93 (+) Transcript_13419:166-444(+)
MNASKSETYASIQFDMQQEVKHSLQSLSSILLSRFATPPLPVSRWSLSPLLLEERHVRMGRPLRWGGNSTLKYLVTPAAKPGGRLPHSSSAG